MSLEYDEAVEVAKKATSLDELYEVFGISGVSPEGWYVSIMWDAFHEESDNGQ